MNVCGKRILVGITGSIAAYKSITLVRLLVKAGAEVKVVMTPAAAEFASPLVLATLSKHPVLLSLATGADWANHVALGRWAHAMVIAPASANSVAKMATGLCDNLLLAVYLSATCPVMICPAMDEDMWLHPSTQANLLRLKGFGNKVLDVETGELASGLFGPGRMAEPEEILSALNELLAKRAILAGKKALVTAGPTYEPIDPVRFIGNHSSGKMGIEIAAALAAAGADVTLVLGPVDLQPPVGVQVIKVTTAQEMYDAAMACFPHCQLTVMAAAVADYRPAVVAAEKIKKATNVSGEDMLTINLVRNPDILKACGQMKQDHQLLVGFALETNNEEENALKKLQEKNADFMVLNSLRDADSGFGTDTNQVTIYSKHLPAQRWPLQQKKALAGQLVEMLALHLPNVAID
ncbi:MAG: bifunctional phosphopantothenoylcysteine decarboxylase/phosphopantothenate--cysteine ligase CoaBC [Bacteroidetes bacterium]|nr:MAG: bifunctional phosphopantothenoylcysteine decarboxylase/phosphopantothenate--cysteine ligase CoaBC [Bacteroidota bacterium]